jgi:hypothetical protein
MALRYSHVLMALTVTALHITPAWAEDVLEVHHAGAISYIAGGIGEDEMNALAAAKQDYNLHIMNADKTGHFSGDVRIVISDLKSHVLLDTSDGPLFYANLPKGKYIVEGFSEQHHNSKHVTITSSKPTRVHFVWPQDAYEAIQ